MQKFFLHIVKHRKYFILNQSDKIHRKILSNLGCPFEDWRHVCGHRQTADNLVCLSISYTESFPSNWQKLSMRTCRIVYYSTCPHFLFDMLEHSNVSNKKCEHVDFFLNSTLWFKIFTIRHVRILARRI